MASMRRAAAFHLLVSVLLAFACAPRPGHSRPLLPPELPAIDSSSLTPPITLGGDRVDVAAVSELGPARTSPRRSLADFALKLRNIAYRHGGRELSTGFDCSGFVRYVYRQSLGLDMPADSASQFQSGTRVDSRDLRMGDLVFFRTQGRRVSHVGIYLDNGLFIHAPSRGKRVRIDHLDDSYWARRFVGAKRPEALG